MPDDMTPDTDAAFWAALVLEMQRSSEPEIQLVGTDASDHEFHDPPANLDEPVEPEPVPGWGESIIW